MPKGVYRRTKPAWNKGLKNYRPNYRHSKETRHKISMALMGNHIAKERWARKEEREKASLVAKELWANPVHRQRHIDALKEYFRNPENRAKRAREIKLRSSNKEYLRKIGEKSRANWQDPEYRKRWLEKTAKARTPEHMAYMNQCRLRATKPNKPETILGELLEREYPSDYVYTGNGKHLIGHLIPDFVCPHRREVVEHFGDYWHRGQNPELRIKRFAKFGFRCLVVWESELKDTQQVAKRLRVFRGN